MKTLDFYIPKNTKGPWHLSRMEGAIKEFVAVFNPTCKIEKTVENFLEDEVQKAKVFEKSPDIEKNDYVHMSPEEYFGWILSIKDCHDWVLEYYFTPKQI